MQDGSEAREVVLVTGPSGAGRTTAIRALEDEGYEVIDNMPLGLAERVVGDGVEIDRLALGLAPRTRGFSVDALIDLTERLRATSGVPVRLIYLDAAPDVLRNRFSETRRRHPLSPEGDVGAGIAAERALLGPVMERADIVIDTTALTPHQLRARVVGTLPGAERGLTIAVESFSYKRGAPPGLDLMMDLRFLDNPHWVPELRPLSGLDAAVRDHVSADPRFAPVFENLRALVLAALPGFRDEGRAYLTVGLGCTGGRHRSVATVELLADALAAEGWRVSKRHRELDRAGTSAARTGGDRP